ncbi:hypothetical protein ACA910_000921 [Epithemia clementina (nom. ined.)]
MAHKRPSNQRPVLWELPHEVLFLVVSYAAGPTRRASLICHKLGHLCRDAKQAFVDNESRAATLWHIVLREDYKGLSSAGEDGVKGINRRSCKRLRKSVLQQVENAHKLIKDRTEIAFFYTSEICSGVSASGNLTKTKLCKVMDEYGPHLRINEVVSSGGLLLVEVCRARNTTENCILNCVKELIERYGAHPDPRTNEANNSQLTALCVGAVRGMSKVVAYLLEKNADTRTKSSGRFRLYTQEARCMGRRKSNRSLRCDNVTPLEFATAMREAEANTGATTISLKGIDRCIKLLS